MKTKVFLAFFLTLILGTAGYAWPAETSGDGSGDRVQKRPSPCYTLNHCRGAPHAEAKSAAECSDKGGGSWKSEEGVCHPDLEGDDEA